MSQFDLHVVSAEAEIYTGQARRLFATASLGEIEITPQHAPLLTSLSAGFIRIRLLDDKEDVVYVSGGILEVQPHVVIVLADTVVRADEFDEAQALKAKQQAESFLYERQDNMDYAKARAELARAVGMLRAIRVAKDKGRLYR